MSVVVVGLQHTQAPLPLLEAAAVPDADLHKTLGAAQPLPQRPGGGRALDLPADRDLRGGRPLPRCRGGNVRRPLRAVPPLRRGPVGPCRRPLRRRRDLTSVLGHLGSRVRGHRGDRSRRPGAACLRAGAGGGHLRPGPLRALPPCVADGQAGADRDRHLQGHHLVRLCRRDRGPRGGPGRACAAPGWWSSAPAKWASACAGHCRTFAPEDAPQRVVVVEPLGGTGAGPGASGGDGAVRHAGGVARARRR